MINVVTSCSAAGWKTYGKRFVETFDQHWPSMVKLYVVSEDDLQDRVYSHKREIIYVDLWKASPQAKLFNDRHLMNLPAHGRAPSQMTPKCKGYNFRYDAYRFSKKVFAIELVQRIVKHGRLYWLDADAVTYAHFNLKALHNLLPDGVALSCLDRGGYHSECGFVGYNLEHAQTVPFIRALAELYASDKVFNLQEWHDSWVFDWLRRSSKVKAHHIPHNSRKHPFVNSEIGFYMDHLKGNRKGKGRTPSEEVLSSKKRQMPYWQGR